MSHRQVPPDARQSTRAGQRCISTTATGRAFSISAATRITASAAATDFFRHIRTNSDRAPVYKEELEARGYSSFDEMHADIIEKDSVDDSKLERTTMSPMKFNRLVLLRPWLWHTAGPGFGDRPRERAPGVYLDVLRAQTGRRSGIADRLGQLGQRDEFLVVAGNQREAPRLPILFRLVDPVARRGDEVPEDVARGSKRPRRRAA